MRPIAGWLDEIRGWFTDNLGYKAVAFVAAVVIWAWVQSEQVVEERARVRVEWRLPEGLVPVEAPVESATLTLEGVQAWVRSVRQKDLSMRIDLTAAEAGEVNVNLADYPVAGLPERVRVVRIAPSNLQVQLDQQLRRKVTVAPSTRGELAGGYQLGAVKVSPDKAELLGPAALLRGLTEVRTDPVDLSGLREDTEFQVGLDLPKGRVTLVRAQAFLVNVEVEPTVVERRVDAVPVLVRDERYRTTTREVSVVLQGPEDRLKAVDPAAVSVVVYLPQGWALSSGEATLGAPEGPRFEVVHPGGDEVGVRSVSPAALILEAR